MAIIYRAYNIISNKSYIGQTTRTIKSRILNHYYAATKKDDLGFKFTYKFVSALRKYQHSDWIWEILEDNIDIALINEKEIEYISLFDSFVNGYNSSLGGDLSPMRIPEIAFKQGQKVKGRKFSEEHKLKLSQARIGIKLSKITKEKIGEFHKGKSWCKGKTHSDKTKELLSIKTNGENNGSAKLTWEDIRYIREKYILGKSENDLAFEFNVSRGHMNKIINNKAWKEKDSI